MNGKHRMIAKALAALALVVAAALPATAGGSDEPGRPDQPVVESVVPGIGTRPSPPPGEGFCGTCV